MHVLALMASTLPPIDPTLLQPVPDGATAQFNAVLPLAIPVLLLFVGVTIALRVFGKVGVKR